MNYQKSLSNKISPLVPGKVLLRDRLFSLFDRPPPNSCFWISGPGGSGKSTLIASYLNHQDLPCLWYQVDVLDGDPSNFFYYLGQAAIALTEQEKPPLPLLTPEYLLDVDSFIVRYFEALYQHLNSPCWIIFDNFQDAPADSLVQHILTKAIEMLPHHVTMAIISRSDPPPEMARFRANRSMSLIDWKQIAFTRDEFYDFVQFSGYRLDEKEIEKIFKLTDGWVAGAILWLSHSGKENVSQCFPIETTPESIFDYFGSEILAKTEFQIKEFLLKTALFPHMSADMASQLTDLDAEVILEDLDRRNFFLEKRNLPTISYQYHPLFREFLLNRASRFFNSASLGDLRCLGAQILIDNGLIEQGVDLYILAQEYEPLISLILSHASVLTSQGRHQILISWIAGLPPKYCETNPWLLFWKGIGLVTTRPFESQALYMQSYELFKQKDDLAGQALSWSMTIDTYPLLRSTFFQLDYWIPEGIQLAESLFDKMDTNSQGRFANSMLTALITRSPGHPDIYRWQSRCEELFEQCFDEQVIVSLGSVLCLSYNQLGQIHKAHIMLTALQPLVDKIDVPPLSRLFCNIWVCTLLLSTGRWTECHKMIDETLALAKETGIYVANFLLLSFGTYLGLKTGDLITAKQYLQGVKEALMPHAAYDNAQYHFMAAWLAMLEEDFHKAKLLCEKSLKFVKYSGNPFGIACTTLLQTQMLLEDDNASQARAVLDHLADQKPYHNSKLVNFSVNLVLADCAFIENRADDALFYLKTAFSGAQENGLVVPLGLNRHRLSLLCAKALDGNIRTDTVIKFIKLGGFLPPPQEVVGDQWPWPVKVYTLGCFEIQRYGEPLSLSAKTPRKPLELLRLLICTRDQKITRESIAARLWPDSDGDRAIQSFNTTLYRLRKLLGHDQAVVLEKGRLRLNPDFCWIDAWYFEKLLQLAGTAESYDQKEELTEKALSIYQGAFDLGSGYNVLSVGYSEQLKNKWAGLVRGYSRELSGDDRGEQALDVLQRALTLDDSIELIYHAFMTILHDQGRTNEAITIFERCRNMLAENGMVPNDTTLSLSRAIKPHSHKRDKYLH